MSRRILVTSALPYANGPLHFGHIIEAVQTDVWVRFQRLRGNECRYVCAEDTHGTPIMIKAQSEGITPEALIARVAAEHRADYEGFLIGHDQFHSTHSAENRHFTDLMFGRLKAAGHITQRSVRQAYDEQAGMFLPDRYVRGTCPRCKAADQYGDSCEVCGATYSPADLIDPKSTLSGTTPVWRDSEHLFFALGRFEAMLREWVQSGSLQDSVRAKLAEWFETGLQDWDISRDAPYFGFEIPGHPGKYFYVWFDAPIGYLGSLKALCDRRGLDIDAFLKPDSDIELHHFIGKDISYFHTLFWPAVLDGSGFRKPTAVHVHGFLTIDGQKMSKSRGTFVTARRYLERLPPEALRYYFAAKLGPAVDDIDLALGDFTARVNSDLVGKLVNIASRCAGFLVKRFDGRLAALDHGAHEGFAQPWSGPEAVAALYEQREFGKAIREIMQFADAVNQYVDAEKPWELAKDPARAADLHRCCSTALRAFRDLVLLLALTPCGAAMSVDRWLRHGRAALATAPEVAPWGMRPLQLQVVTVYVFAFWTKSGDLWANGTAVSTVLRVDDLQRLSVPDWVVSNVLLIAALTWGALAIEFALGFGLWFRRARHPLIVCGILLHGSIGAFLLVGFFGPTMVAGLCAFVAPATARRLLLAPTRALWAPRGVGTPAALPPAPR